MKFATGALAYNFTACGAPSAAKVNVAAEPAIDGRSSAMAGDVRLRKNAMEFPLLSMARVPVAYIDGVSPFEQATCSESPLSPNSSVPETVEKVGKVMVAAETEHAELNVALTVIAPLLEPAAPAIPLNAIDAAPTANKAIFCLVNIVNVSFEELDIDPFHSRPSSS